MTTDRPDPAGKPGEQVPGEEKTVDSHVDGADSAPGAGLEREDAQPDEAAQAPAAQAEEPQDAA